MAALVCDICGGKLVMGPKGVAVCDSCGMEHSAERVKEKVQEIKGTVRVDNSHMVNNYLEMAQSANEAGNQEEAEIYCNKVIEIDPTNYQALILKGEVVAWQSSLAKSRVDEGVSSFVKGIDYAPEDMKEELIEKVKNQIKRLSLAMISLRAERFAKWPDKEEATGFLTDIISILNTNVGFLSRTGNIVPVEELMAPIADKINESVVQAWKNVILPEFRGNPNDPDDKPNKYDWQKFIERIGYCTDLLEKAIDLCDEDDEEDIQRYENLIHLHQSAIDSCSWDYNITSWGKSWYKEWQLSDGAKAARKATINLYETKIQTIKKAKEDREEAERQEQERIENEEKQKRIDAYWAEHESEKTALEQEQYSLMEQISVLQTEMNNVPGSSEKQKILNRINALKNEKNALGLFKGKEKKVIQEKIDLANEEFKAISDRIETVRSEIMKRMQLLQERYDEIEKEFAKDR